MILIPRTKLETIRGLLLDLSGELSNALDNVSLDDEIASITVRLVGAHKMINDIDDLLAANCPMGIEDGDAHMGNALCMSCEQQGECEIFIPF